MKTGISSFRKTMKETALIVSICAVLILSPGVVSVFAENPDEESNLVKMMGGIISSSDGDNMTWVEGTPNGFYASGGNIDVVMSYPNSEVKAITWSTGNSEGEASSGMLKIEDGNMFHSNDGGITWNEEAPEGFDTYTDDDGKTIMAFRGNPGDRTDFDMLNIKRYPNSEGKTITWNSTDEANSGMLKMEDGNMFHSTDGGITWNEGAPEGFNAYTNDDGKTITTFRSNSGNRTDFDMRYTNVEGKTIAWSTGNSEGVVRSGMVKMKDGNMFYSNDGGVTWDEGAPDGASISPDESVIFPR